MRVGHRDRQRLRNASRGKSGHQLLYIFPRTHGSLVVQNGSSTAISDLTVSAGWTVVECGDSDASQDIRVACHDPSKGCNHLYLNGAEHTVVRLPEEVSLPRCHEHVAVHSCPLLTPPFPVLFEAVRGRSIRVGTWRSEHPRWETVHPQASRWFNANCPGHTSDE